MQNRMQRMIAAAVLGLAIAGSAQAQQPQRPPQQPQRPPQQQQPRPPQSRPPENRPPQNRPPENRPPQRPPAPRPPQYRPGYRPPQYYVPVRQVRLVSDRLRRQGFRVIRVVNRNGVQYVYYRKLMPGNRLGPLHFVIVR